MAIGKYHSGFLYLNCAVMGVGRVFELVDSMINVALYTLLPLIFDSTGEAGWLIMT